MILYYIAFETQTWTPLTEPGFHRAQTERKIQIYLNKSLSFRYPGAVQSWRGANRLYTWITFD